MPLHGKEARADADGLDDSSSVMTEVLASILTEVDINVENETREIAEAFEESFGYVNQLIVLINDLYLKKEDWIRATDRDNRQHEDRWRRHCVLRLVEEDIRGTAQAGLILSSKLSAEYRRFVDAFKSRCKKNNTQSSIIEKEMAVDNLVDMIAPYARFLPYTAFELVIVSLLIDALELFVEGLLSKYSTVPAFNNTGGQLMREIESAREALRACMRWHGVEAAPPSSIVKTYTYAATLGETQFTVKANLITGTTGFAVAQAKLRLNQILGKDVFRVSEPLSRDRSLEARMPRCLTLEGCIAADSVADYFVKYQAEKNKFSDESLLCLMSRATGGGELEEDLFAEIVHHCDLDFEAILRDIEISNIKIAMHERRSGSASSVSGSIEIGKTMHARADRAAPLHPHIVQPIVYDSLRSSDAQVVRDNQAVNLAEFTKDLTLMRDELESEIGRWRKIREKTPSFLSGAVDEKVRIKLVKYDALEDLLKANSFHELVGKANELLTQEGDVISGTASRLKGMLETIMDVYALEQEEDSRQAQRDCSISGEISRPSF